MNNKIIKLFIFIMLGLFMLNCATANQKVKKGLVLSKLAHEDFVKLVGKDYLINEYTKKKYVRKIKDFSKINLSSRFVDINKLFKKKDDIKKLRSSIFIKETLHTPDEEGLNLIFHAAHSGNVELLRVLLELGVSQNIINKKRNETLLTIEILSNYDKIFPLVINNYDPKDINLINVYNCQFEGIYCFTALGFAIWRERGDFAIQLLKMGADPNIFRNAEESSLFQNVRRVGLDTYYEIKSGKSKYELQRKRKKLLEKSLNFLIDKGADPYAKGEDGIYVISAIAGDDSIANIIKLKTLFKLFKKHGKEIKITDEMIKQVKKLFKKNKKSKFPTKEEKEKIIEFLEQYK